MTAPLLFTKLYIPPSRPGLVPRPRLIERLNECLETGCRLTLISAPAGFGKTTLVSEWIAECGRQAAWLSLDEGDDDPARFVTYLIKALQTIRVGIGEGLLAALQSSQPLQIETILTTLLNEISAIPENFLLVLDDYHSIDSPPVDQSLAFLIEHQPPQMHLLIATREDPDLPLARLRARGQCAELRAANLRFTPAEAAEFLNRLMGLNLSEADIAALEARTEGWIAGLQMAAISMKGLIDTTGFIQSFTGSHRFVLDYLLEEVLQRQPADVQTFLLRTSILDCMCGPLCDAVLRDPSVPGQATLEYLEHANLFIVPQDNERGWYRYHHLFRDLLRKRLGQSLTMEKIADLNIHASEWYENNDLMFDAFRHATAAKDIERAVRLMESKRMPLHRRGTATTILDWLESLPKTVLDARPSLWWMQAAMLLTSGQLIGVEEKLQATEAALALAVIPGATLDETTRDLIGKIAAARANVAQAQAFAQTETILIESRRALEYLRPDNLSDRSMATRSLGLAYFFQEDLAMAGRAYAEALSLAQAAGDIVDSSLASIRLGQVQEAENQLPQAAETYQRVLPLVDEYSPHNTPLVYLGLARIYYEWNDLDAAEMLGEKSVQLARQYDQVVDRLVVSEVFLSCLKLAQGDVTGAMDKILQAEQTSRLKNYTYRLPDIAYTRARIQLYQGNVDEAAQLVRQNDIPLMQARVLVAQDNPPEALALVEPLRQQAEEKRLPQRLLEVKAVQAVILFANGERDKAVQVLAEALALAEPGGYIRLFLGEGALMAQLLREAASRGMMPDYTGRLLAALEAEQPRSAGESPLPAPVTAPPERRRQSPRPAGERGDDEPLTEPLSQRELDVLRLLQTELSGPEIARGLVISLSTVRTHTKSIYSKLNVNNRRAAVKRAVELHLI